MQSIVQQLWNTVHGNGEPGIAKKLDRFIAGFIATEREREKQHEQNRWRLNLIIAILVAIAAYIAIVVSIRTPAKSLLDPHKVFHSENKLDVARNQNAGSPIDPHY